MSKEVAKAKETAVGEAFDYGDLAGKGFEDATMNDVQIPFVQLLQSNSEVIENGTIPDAKAGDLLNTVTGEIIRQPMIIQPILREHQWAEWVPRAKGGGKVGSYDDDHAIITACIKANGGDRVPPMDAAGEKRMPFKHPESGNDLIETFYLYAMLMNEEGTETEGYACIPFSSTKIAVFKRFYSAMLGMKGRPPISAFRAKLETVRATQKTSGKGFFNYQILPFADNWRNSLIKPDAAGMALIQDANKMGDMITGGLASVVGESQDAAEGGGGGSAGDQGEDDEMPF